MFFTLQLCFVVKTLVYIYFPLHLKATKMTKFSAKNKVEGKNSYGSYI